MRTCRALICVLTALAVAPPAGAGAADLWSLYQRQDYFALRARLPRERAGESERLLFLRAATQASFGRHATAVATLRRLLERRPDRDLWARARRLLMREERVEGRYAAALAAIKPLMTAASSNDPDQVDLRNSALLLTALADVPPQTLQSTASSVVLERRADGRFPVAINGHQLAMGFDTGAAFSFLAASTAQKAGLRVRRIGMALGSSTGVDAGGDVAVGDVAIGQMTIRNVVFLVLPDAGLTMSDGFFMPGLLGFPVMAALGPVKYGRDGSMRLGATAPAGEPNLALDGNRVLARVKFKNADLLCRLDTGADDTVFYEPFYRRFPELFGDPARSHTLKLGGVSGAQEIAAYQLSSVEISLAGNAIHLPHPNVLEASIEGPTESQLACNVGLDALKPFASYVIDLQHLRLDIGGRD